MSSDLSSSHWASIRKRPRKNGTTAHTVLYWIDGRQTGITFDDPRQADALATLIRAHGARRALSMHGIDPTPRTRDPQPPLTVGTWIGRHLDALSGIERKTLTEYKRYLTRDIEPILGAVPLAALRRSDISSWVNTLRDGGASGKTIQNKMGFLSGCLNAAVREGELTANPAAGIRLPRTVRREMCFLTRDEYQILRSCFAARWHPQALYDILTQGDYQPGDFLCLERKASQLLVGAENRW